MRDIKTQTIIILLSILVPQAILELAEDGRLDFPSLARKYGYSCKERTVITEDGYILKLFHVPGNSRLPILLMHGFIDSADTFMIRGNKSLVAILANQGYDIWAGNTRGTHYTRTHVQLDPDKDKEFWNFSFHEISYYDLPAIIDFVLDQTKANKLNAIGHSQGNTVFYVMGSLRPEYNEKINVLIALGPVGYLGNLPAPWNFLIQSRHFVNNILLATDTEEVFNKQLKNVIRTICDTRVEMCNNLLGELAGTDADELESDFILTLIGHYPTSTSRKNIKHWLQNGAVNKFCRMDYGRQKNMEVYGQVNPPEYDLKRVTFRVALYAGMNDKLTPMKNVELLEKQLPNVIEYRIMKRKRFNHLDHVWGRNMDKYLFPHVLKTLQMYN